MRKIVSASVAALAMLVSTSAAVCASTGRVVDTNGGPIANAEVTSIQWKSEGPVVRKALSGPDGRFTFPLKHGPDTFYPLYLVLADGYSWGKGMTEFPDVDKEITITLFKEQKLRGKVVDEQGRPLAGVRIAIERTQQYDGKGRNLEFNFDPADWRISETTTRRDGTFALSHLPSQKDLPLGYVKLSAGMQDRATITRTIQQSDLGNELTITLPQACALAGVMHLPGRTGMAPEGYPMVIRPVDGDWGTQREFSLGKDGRFLVSQLAPGAYQLATGPAWMFGRTYPGTDGEIEVHVPKQPNWVVPAVDVSIGPSEAKIIDVQAVAGATISGRVVSLGDGKPVANAVVAAVHPGRPKGFVPTATVTDSKGEFTLRVAPGDVSLDVASAFVGSSAHTFQPGDNQGASLKLAEGDHKTDVCLKVKPTDTPDSSEQPEDGMALGASVRSKPAMNGLALKPGSYAMKWDPDVPLYHAMSWQPDSHKDPDVRRLMTNIPKLSSEKAMFLAFRFDGDGETGLLLSIVDESSGTGSGFDTIYFDRNRNADLTDDEPVKMPRLGSFRYAYSKWADVVLYQGEPSDRRAFTAKVRVEYYVSPSHQQISLQRKGAWRGKLDSNKGPLDCVFTPGFNMSGPSGKHTTRVDVYDSGTGDTIYIDTNGYGQAMVLGNTPQTVQLDVPAKVGSGFYHIDVSTTGDKVTVKPYAGRLGKFRVTSSGVSGFRAKPVEISLYNDHGEYTFEPTTAAVQLPAGTYKLHHVTFDLTREGSDNVGIICATHNPILIQPGKTTTTDISGKISLELAPRARYLALDAGAINGIGVRAKIGEGVTVVAIGKVMYSVMGSSSMGEYFPTGYSAENYFHPQIEILAKDGEAVFSGKADASSNNPWLSASCGIKLPAIGPGAYNLRLIANTQTPLGTLVTTKEAIVRDPALTELEKRFTWKISFGRPYEVVYRNYGEYPSVDKLSAVVTWYNENDRVRISADVSDAFLSTDPFQRRSYRASSIQFCFAPNGAGSQGNGLVVVPKGDNGVPEVQSNLKGIRAHYKRTAKGYRVDISMPWNSLAGYTEGWKLMPVGVVLTARTGKDRTQLQLTQSTDVYSDVRGFPALVAP